MNAVRITIFVTEAASAFVLHETILKRKEIDHLALPLVAGFAVAFWLVVYYSSFYFATLAASAFLVPLSLKILVYRAFFHPLRNFPGPFGARLSKWWTVKQVVDTNWRLYRVHLQLQKKYGDYVRTGPRELTIFDPAAIPALLGLNSQTTKGPWYDIMDKSLHLTRDHAFHRQRRKIWDVALKESLSDYAPQVEEFTSQLLDRIRAEEGKPVPMLEYFTYYAYDVMSVLTFGKPMGFVRGESSDVAQSILHTFQDSLMTLGALTHVPWLMKAFWLLGSWTGPLKRWSDWSQAQMRERMTIKESRPDLAQHLITNTSKNPNGMALLFGDTRLIITAGSDTTSTSLTLLFVRLALHPEYLQAIRNEYREKGSSYSCEKPSPILESVIHESMRLAPAVYFASQRVTPRQGLTINGHYIPGNTILGIAPFPLSQDPRSFVNPKAFIPERWTTKPDLVLNKDAFLPFSTGPYSCVGKGLAMLEIRSVVSRLTNEFDIVLPEGFDADAFYGSVSEHVVAGPPNQIATFRRVKQT